MNIRIFPKAALFLGTVLTAGFATGLRAETIRMNIPFSFTVGGTAMPAGVYRMTAEEHVLLIAGPASAAILLSPETIASSDTFSAVFENQGGKPVLASVKTRSGTARLRGAERAPSSTASAKGSAVLSRH